MFITSTAKTTKRLIEMSDALGIDLMDVVREERLLDQDAFRLTMRNGDVHVVPAIDIIRAMP